MKFSIDWIHLNKHYEDTLGMVPRKAMTKATFFGDGVLVGGFGAFFLFLFFAEAFFFLDLGFAFFFFGFAQGFFLGFGAFSGFSFFFFFAHARLFEFTDPAFPLFEGSTDLVAAKFME